jgi:hypothetical protein
MAGPPLRIHLSPPPPRLPAPIADLLTAIRAIPSSPTALNFYDEAASQADGDAPGQASQRLEWLTRYLCDRWAAPVVLIGEAPGYQGARHSGIAFTSQHQLTGAGWKEPSASIVHGALATIGHEHNVLLWNSTTLHPRLAPNQPNTNRKPTQAELDLAAAATELVTSSRIVVAVGKVASGLTGAPYVRHPARGGANEFRSGLAAFMASHDIVPDPQDHVPSLFD